MTRSKRKTPIVPITTAKSDKPFKKAEHQRERAQIKVKLKGGTNDANLPAGKAYGNPAQAEKDGRQYLGGELKRMKLAQRIAKGSDAVDKKRVARAFKKLTGK